MSVVWWDVAASSNVDQVGYDDETQTILVRWKRNKKGISAYSGVPADVAESAPKNWSVTDFINNEIKPNYNHRYV